MMTHIMKKERLKTMMMRKRENLKSLQNMSYVQDKMMNKRKQLSESLDFNNWPQSITELNN